MGALARAALYLSAGRTVGFIVLFAVPIVLSRLLTLEDFGAYKYFFLLYGTLSFLQLGMAESLYFFVPQSAERSGRVVANAVITLMLSGGLAFVVIAGLSETIAPIIGHAGIGPWLPLLGAFLGLMLIAAPLEIVMVSRRQNRLAALTYAGSDTVRSLLLVVPALLSRSLTAILIGAVVFAAIRCAWMIGYLVRHFRTGLRPDRRLWHTQLVYALPFTAAVLVELVQFNLHQYVVAARFDPATFAIYSVGCMQIPVVDLVALSAANVMMVRMSEQRAGGEPVLAVWLATVARLSLIFVPLTVALVITAGDVIAVLYPPEYLPSVPILVIATGLVALAAIPVDAVLRVFARTRFLIVMNLIRLAIVLSGIWWAIGTFDLRGAIAITVVAQAVAKVVALGHIAALLETDWRGVLPWRTLGAVLVAAIVAAVPAWWVHEWIGWPPLARGAATAGVYAAAYALAIATARSSVTGQVARHFGWRLSSGL
jgi:O-antigen/teichoic acid export membrane protein